MTLTQILQKIRSTFYTKSESDTKLNNKANDSDVVKLSGDQTINGIKTFSAPKTTNISNVNSDGTMYLLGGTVWQDGSRIELLGSNHTDTARKGGVSLISLNPNSSGGYDQSNLLLDSNGSLYPYYFTSPPNLGTSINKWKYINGFDVTGIGHIGNSGVDQSGSTKTYTRTNPNVGNYAHYCVAPDNGWVACREHGGSGTFQVCALGSDLNSDPIIISPPLNQYKFGSVPVRKGEYYAIVSG